MANGKMTEASLFASQPNPHTTNPPRRIIAATASAVSENQITRDCFSVGEDRAMSALSQLLRFLRRGTNRIDECAAHFSFFQFVQTFNRRSAGTRHHVF